MKWKNKNKLEKTHIWFGRTISDVLDTYLASGSTKQRSQTIQNFNSRKDLEKIQETIEASKNNQENDLLNVKKDQDVVKIRYF